MRDEHVRPLLACSHARRHTFLTQYFLDRALIVRNQPTDAPRMVSLKGAFRDISIIRDS